MLTTDPQILNEQFAIAQHVTFTATTGGLPVAQIHNSHPVASVAVQGGHVITYQPHGQAPVLFASSLTEYAPGKTIRGGIPVCWPWFGAHPTDPSKPFHGFVRTAMWQVRGASVGPGDATEVRLGLTESEASLAIWPYDFDLELVVSVGAQLHVELTARNPGDRPFVSGGALHSYYAVGDARRLAIHGLDGREYLDKVEGFMRKQQHGPVTI